MMDASVHAGSLIQKGTTLFGVFLYESFLMFILQAPVI